jgi:hypothetical protein
VWKLIRKLFKFGSLSFYVRWTWKISRVIQGDTSSASTLEEIPEVYEFPQVDPYTPFVHLRPESLIIVAFGLQPGALELAPSNVVSYDEFEKFKDEISRDVKNGPG